MVPTLPEAEDPLLRVCTKEARPFGGLADKIIDAALRLDRVGDTDFFDIFEEMPMVALLLFLDAFVDTPIVVLRWDCDGNA